MGCPCLVSLCSIDPRLLDDSRATGLLRRIAPRNDLRSVIARSAATWRSRGARSNRFAPQLLEQRKRIELQQYPETVGEVPPFHPVVAGEARDAHFVHLDAFSR